MEHEDREYYETLIDLFTDPEALEKFLKACVKAHAVHTEQLQSLKGCAEEMIEYLKMLNRRSPSAEYANHRWFPKTDLEKSDNEDAIELIWRSIELLDHYGAE
jgi:hypothetical protein